LNLPRWGAFLVLIGCLVTGGGRAGSPLQPASATPTPVPESRPVSPEASPLDDAADWPQLQHDAQHTGASTQEVRPPYRYYWRWNEAPLASRAQPVVAANRLFIGSLNGKLYALDADQDAGGGAPTVLWVQDTGAPIRHSAAVQGNRVYVGTHSGHVHAFDTATGTPVWSYLTGGGIATAPVVGNNIVYIGSTDGIFYALNANTGALVWKYTVNAPILTSAALSADGQTVYLGAEDLYAYALGATSGTLRWRTRLQGQSLAERWPVVAGNNVIYRSQSLYYFHTLLHNGDSAMDAAGALNPDWEADWAAVRPRIVSYLAAHPAEQTFFALEASTGALRGPAPVLYTFGNGDAPDPPVVKDGALYLRYRARHGIQTDGGSGHVSSLYDAELGRMDLSTLDITGLRASASTPFNYQFRATSDEPSMLSIGGNLLYIDSWERLGALDLTNGTLIPIANVANNWNACPPASTPPSPPDPAGQCPIREGPLPFFTTAWPFPGPQVGEGIAHRPLVIASGRLFWRVSEGGLAAIGHATTEAADTARPELAGSPAVELTPPLTLLPAALAATPPLSTYVWTEPTRPVAHPAPDLVARLSYEVQRLVDTNAHLLPFVLERGFTDHQTFPGDSLYPADGLVICQPGNSYWFDPGELIYTLSAAYPYLTPTLQSKVRTYLAGEMSRYPPLQRLGDNWQTVGVRRESYPVAFTPNCWPPPVPPLSTLYGLWAYARYTGDWSYLQSHWNEIDTLFDSKKGNVDTYAGISGAIGYARIARQLGKTAAASEGETVAVQAMTSGKNFNTFLAAANARCPDPRRRYTGLRAPVFFGLVPEVGRYLSDTNRLTATAYLNDITDADAMFLWYLTRLGLQAELGESSFNPPETAWSIFLAKAYVQGASATQLRIYLDRPWGLGDLYYIQKLVATIESTGVIDTTPPQISGLQVSDITFCGATFRWQTDDAASTEVEFGTTTAYGQSLVQLAALTDHQLQVNGMRPGTLHHYRVCSTSAGGRSCSADGTLTTLPGFELFLPIILKK